MRSAVLFLVFNRPETTAEVFRAIRRARPTRLYIAADGPRPGRDGEAGRVAEVRSIAAAVDWPCQVRTLFRESNLGCKFAVSGAISWFFENEPEGIVLEDDTVPLPSFFTFADELLERYRHDERVALISGSNHVTNAYTSPHSYFFSAYPHIWGWAGWRRTWQHYDVAMTDWPELRGRDHLADVALTNREHWKRRWYGALDATHAGKVDSWAYPLAFAILSRRGLAATPRTNLVNNIGFGVDATHTRGMAPRYVRDAVTAELDLPLTHPGAVTRDLTADRLDELHVQGLSVRNRVIANLASYRFGATGLRVAQRGKAVGRGLVESLRGRAADYGRASFKQ